jgi:hypothetical protein
MALAITNGRHKEKKMRKNLNKILLIIIMTGLVSNVFAEVKLRTEADVAAYADSITGFKDINGITKSFKRVTITDDNTPFLQKQINGRNVWVAEYKDFKLELKSDPSEDKYKRNFKVYIDPNDGKILKITSKYDGFDPNLFPEPNVASAERQLQYENYIGFPNEPSKISFIDAIAAVIIGNPFEAKEIDALYTWYSTVGKEPRRVWVITLRGLPPTDVHNPTSFKNFVQPPVWQRNHTRNIIDADTGNCSYSLITPHPEDPNKTKK